MHKRRDETATWEGEKEQWRELQKRREDASARKTRLQPYQQFLTGENSSGLFYAASNKPVTEKRGENNITWLKYLCVENNMKMSVINI